MFVIDRKNFLFANTPKGATASAVTFSIIQTAMANKLEPYRYLTYILAQAARADRSTSDWVHSLLPQNTPASCRL